MSERTKKALEVAHEMQSRLDAEAKSGSFAHQLAGHSLRSHIDELETLASISRMQGTYEIVDFRLSAPMFRHGSVPLAMLSTIAADFRALFGHGALRSSEGGIQKKRVPHAIYEALDLRLAGLLPGSARLVIAAASNRNLFDEGPAQQCLSRLFGVLRSEGKGQDFLQAISDLGPASARKLRGLLRVARAQSAEVEVTWTHLGAVVDTWKGTQPAVDAITSALELAELSERQSQTLVGTVELLSKRERIHVRVATGQLIRILFPLRLLPQVAELHLDQRVTVDCEVTEAENPITGETSMFYEMTAVR